VDDAACPEHLVVVLLGFILIIVALARQHGRAVQPVGVERVGQKVEAIRLDDRRVA